MAARTWGRLRVIEGSCRFALAVVPAVDVELRDGGVQAIPPEVPHAVHLAGPVCLELDFLVAPSAAR